MKKGTGLLRFTTKGAAKIKETRLSKPDNPSVIAIDVLLINLYKCI